MRVEEYLLSDGVMSENEPLSLPHGAKILWVDFLKTDFFLWAFVDENEPMREDRRILVVSTWAEVPVIGGELTPINSFLFNRGSVFLAFHAFERVNLVY